MVSCLRLLMPDINIAATTALQAIDPEGREKALEIGANVIMPNITPLGNRGNYRLYENKPGMDEGAEESTRRLMESVKPVSYTHLDVYKRQLRCLFFILNPQIKPGFQCQHRPIIQAVLPIIEKFITHPFFFHFFQQSFGIIQILFQIAHILFPGIYLVIIFRYRTYIRQDPVFCLFTRCLLYTSRCV